MKGEIVLVDEVFDEESEFEIGVSNQEFSLSIYVDEEYTLEKQLKNKERFDYCINKFLDFLKSIDEYDEKKLKDIIYVSNNFDNILDSTEYIKLAFTYTNNLEFIKENPVILSKKIVLNEHLDVKDEDKILKLIDEYKEIIDKVYVYLIGNRNYVSLLDCYKTINKIKQQAEDIKKLNLSPIETIMYTYDQVRNRVYKREDENETIHKSRDLSEVLFGDKIVCAGYARTFSALLDYMGIENKIVLLSNINNDGGHERNEIYVNDDKYDIDGVYYFDATWDSKKEENKNDYLYYYRFFAKTRNYMDENEVCECKNAFFPVFSTNMYEEVKQIIKEKNYKDLRKYAKSINYMSYLVNDHSLIELLQLEPTSGYYGQLRNDLLKEFENTFNKFNKELSAETMIKILKKVRKIEHYQNPNWYFYSMNDIYKTMILSEWKFENEHLNQYDLLLQSLFNEKQEKTKAGTFINYADEIELKKEIEQIELTKTLKLIKEKKEKSN